MNVEDNAEHHFHSADRTYEPPERDFGRFNIKDVDATVIKREINGLNKGNAATINPASVKALSRIKKSDMQMASVAIQGNRRDIHKEVDNQEKEFPNLYGKGKRVISDLASGSDADDMLPSERFAAERVITGIATLALLGAGIIAFSMCAAPAGVLIGRFIFEQWSMGKGGQNLRDDLNVLRGMRRRKESKARRQRENELAAQYKATASQQAQDSGIDPVDLVIDQVADVLTFLSPDDLVNDAAEQFHGIASAVYIPSDDSLLLRLSGAHNIVPYRKGVCFEHNDLSMVKSIYSNYGHCCTTKNHITAIASNTSLRTAMKISPNRYYMVLQ